MHRRQNMEFGILAPGADRAHRAQFAVRKLARTTFFNARAYTAATHFKVGSLVLMLSVSAQGTADCVRNASSALGPLSLRSQSPGQALRLTPVARSADVIPEGKHEFQAVYTVTSIYASDTGYYLDFHLADKQIALSSGLGNCWDMEIAWGERALVNAYLDDITLTFHRLFGYSNSGQDEVERNDTTIDIPGYGIHRTEEDRGIFSRSVALTLKHRFDHHEERYPSLSTSLQVRHETEETSGNGTDLGLGIHLGKDIGEDYIHANFNYVWFGSNRYLGLPLKDRQFSYMLGYEWRETERFSWLAQYLYSQGVMKHLGGLSEPARELHLGAKWRWRNAVAELALIENVVTYNNSPDFGFALGLTLPF